MHLIAIERELPIPIHTNLPDILRQEAAEVWALQKRGIIRHLWFTAPDRHAIIMLECAGVAEAREHLATLPLVRHGLAEFNILELRAYDGFERLFNGGATPASPAKPAEPPEY
jgi:muconolactone delta-isomerase